VYCFRVGCLEVWNAWIVHAMYFLELVVEGLRGLGGVDIAFKLVVEGLVQG